MTTFFQLLFAGIAQGALYSLVALGFTVVYRSSRVINFAQGELLAFGAFLTSSLVSHNLNFWPALLIGVVVTALVGLAFQVFVLRWALGRPDFTLVMLTLGLASVLQVLVGAIWGSTQRSNGDPWGAKAFHLGGVVLSQVSLWSIVAVLLVLAAFLAFNRFSRYGLAMRAAAHDAEAALAVGIPLRRVHALSWALAGGLACIGGVFLGGYPSTVDPSISNTALLAFPAIILGGIDSIGGAIAGGFVIGVVEQLVEGYQPTYAAWLGNNFYLAAPYVVMILVLLIRPYGLFGSRPAERL
jgi:branched-chain amino acid transport system permease protein